MNEQEYVKYTKKVNRYRVLKEEMENKKSASIQVLRACGDTKYSSVKIQVNGNASANTDTKLCVSEEMKKIIVRQLNKEVDELKAKMDEIELEGE